MSMKDYNDGYLGRRRYQDPTGPKSNSADYSAGVRARQNAYSNYASSIYIPPKKAAPVQRVNFAAPAAGPEVYRERKPFETTAADVLALAVAGAIIYVGIQALHWLPGIACLVGAVVGWITHKLFCGPLRFLLVVVKYVLKTALFVIGGWLLLYMFLQGMKK